VIKVERQFIVNTESDMINLGKQIGDLLTENMVLGLSGDLGAGKTTFTKGVGKGLNVKSIINSPTFTILKIHQGRMPLYHMDVYRISKNSGDDDLEEFFEKKGVTVVEWAENIDFMLPEDFLKIEIKNLGNTSRRLTLSSNDKKYIKIIESVAL